MQIWKKEVKILIITFLALVTVSLYRQYYMNVHPENAFYPFVVYLMYMAVALGERMAQYCATSAGSDEKFTSTWKGLSVLTIASICSLPAP